VSLGSHGNFSLITTIVVANAEEVALEATMTTQGEMTNNAAQLVSFATVRAWVTHFATIAPTIVVGVGWGRG
jgi:hypothetical protein